MALPDERLAPVLGAAEPPLVNVGSGEELSIAELAAMVRRVVGCAARIDWDRAKPDGTPRKLLDVARLACAEYAAEGPEPSVLP